MHRLTLSRLDVHPEPIDSKSYNCKQKPLYPVSKQLHSGTIKFQALTFYDSVLYFPVVNHAVCPRQTNAESCSCNKGAKNAVANKLKQSAIKIRFFVIYSSVPHFILIVILNELQIITYENQCKQDYEKINNKMLRDIRLRGKCKTLALTIIRTYN